MMTSHAISTQNASETRQLGMGLGKALAQHPMGTPPIVIFLQGDLGTGKTTFVSGLLAAIGIKGSARSPTYTLIEPYETPAIQLYHMDLYRIAVASELEMLAIKDILLPNAVLLIEWAERAEQALPSPDLVISLSYSMQSESKTFDEQERLIAIEARSTVGETLCTAVLASTRKLP